MRRRNFLPPAFARESEFPQWCAISTLSLERQWHGSWIIYTVALRVQGGDAHLNIAESTAFSRGEKACWYSLPQVSSQRRRLTTPLPNHVWDRAFFLLRNLDRLFQKIKKPALNIYPQQRRLNHAKPTMPEFLV
jgi:hypothetical protein